MLRCDWLSYYQAICYSPLIAKSVSFENQWRLNRFSLANVLIFLPTSSILQKQLFLSPSWPLSKAEWAIDSEPIRARVIIVKYY